MNVFVSTKASQGMRGNDFSYASEGELVRFGSVCDGGTVDDKCGCSRSMAGMKSHKSTTTVLVTNKNLTRKQYLDALHQSYVSSGWAKVMDKETLAESVEQEGTELLDLASKLMAEDVYEIRGQKIRARGSYAKLQDPSNVEKLRSLRALAKPKRSVRTPRKSASASTQLKGMR